MAREIFIKISTEIVKKINEENIKLNTWEETHKYIENLNSKTGNNWGTKMIGSIMQIVLELIKK
ncbi:hypothetical protein [Spiroplasma chrysopicola]|uniref:Uncharacterized protein n=1 Tax=Spiroplasma chrysopicola DF-1 TaxID=1276227 RepID=R4U2D1_9MOLU|nr:hypothetical protein [Spiroplasma chrysopicola]AGM25517.1 hypothetical protein SCHRY_v1c09450 [Spiroplasma chrysopicola DF-1]